MYSRYDFKRVFETGGLGIVQPDWSHAGGITECIKIATMAEAYYIPVSPHNAMGPLQVVAGAHVCMTIPNFYRLEHSMAAIPSYQSYLTEPMNFHDGGVTLNGKPGLGYEIDKDQVMATLHPDWVGQV